MKDTKAQPETTDATGADKKALAQCWNCFDDGQPTTIGIPMLKRLTAQGWLDKVGRNRWEVTPEGEAVLREMGVPP